MPRGDTALSIKVGRCLVKMHNLIVVVLRIYVHPEGASFHSPFSGGLLMMLILFVILVSLCSSV